MLIGQCFLTLTGIDNDIVSASIETSEVQEESGHVWNLTTINGKKYFCDPTYEGGTGKKADKV